MAVGKPVGRIFAELSLDTDKYTAAQRRILREASQTSLKIEKNWRIIGQKSDIMYDAMRQRITNAYEAIKNKATSTSQEIVRAETAARKQIKRIDEQQHGRRVSMIDSIKKHWLAASAVIVGAWMAIRRVVEKVSSVIMAAARYETLGIVMRVVGNNAGYTGEQMLKFQKSLESTGIAMTETRHILTVMNQAQIDLNKATALGRIAQDAAVIGNINSSEALAALIHGIHTANVRVLRTIGIQVSWEHSYAKVAKEMGRTVNSLTLFEKTQIRVGAAIEAGIRISGSYGAAMETAGKQILSLQRHFDNLKVLAGAAFTPALAEIVERITEGIKGMNKELSGEGAQAISDWGTGLRITLISVEAEIMRLAMLLDKVGGTFTSAAMLLYGPGAALGIDSSTKKFEAMAEKNMMFQERYIATERALIALAEKQIALEDSLTEKGKARAKARQDALEKERVKALTRIDTTVDKQDDIRGFVAQQDIMFTGLVRSAKRLNKEFIDINELNLFGDWTTAIRLVDKEMESAAASRLDIANDLTSKIKKLTLSETNFKIWSLNQETEALRKKFQSDKEILDQITQFHNAALNKIKENTEKTFGGDMKNAVSGWANNFSSTLTDMVFGAELSFKSIARSFAKMITQMIIQKAVVGPLLGIFGLTPAASGGTFSGLGVIKNQVINKPTVVPFAAGGVLIGEGGSSEAVMPLTRTRSGDLGVKTTGGGGGNNIQYIDMRESTFLDQETMAQTMGTIAEVKIQKFATQVIVNDFNFDGDIRSIMGRA